MLRSRSIGARTTIATSSWPDIPRLPQTLAFAPMRRTSRKSRIRQRQLRRRHRPKTEIPARRCRQSGRAPMEEQLFEFFDRGIGLRKYEKGSRAKCVPPTDCCWRNWLDLYAPKACVGLRESDADFPGFVAAPDDFALGAATGFGEHEPNLPAEGDVRAYDGHAAGMA